MGGPSIDPCILLSIRLPHWHRTKKLKTKKERERSWDQSTRTLAKYSLVCLIRQSSTGWTPVRFGTIQIRSSERLRQNLRLVSPSSHSWTCVPLLQRLQSTITLHPKSCWLQLSSWWLLRVRAGTPLFAGNVRRSVCRGNCEQHAMAGPDPLW